MEVISPEELCTRAVCEFFGIDYDDKSSKPGNQMALVRVIFIELGTDQYVDLIRTLTRDYIDQRDGECGGWITDDIDPPVGFPHQVRHAAQMWFEFLTGRRLCEHIRDPSPQFGDKREAAAAALRM